MALLWIVLAITMLLGGSKTRLCEHCGERNPEDAFIHNICRKCKNKRIQASKRKKCASTPPSVSKECGRCRVTKPADAFYKCNTAPGGLQWSCKDCQIPQRHETPAVRRENEQYATDASYRLKKGIKHRIMMALDGANKSSSTIELLGCTIPEAQKHLESQFAPGMTWENRGEWHIDHVVPCASFDLTDPTQQLECFNYKNLQPSWARDNISKGARLDWLPPAESAYPAYNNADDLENTENKDPKALTATASPQPPARVEKRPYSDLTNSLAVQYSITASAPAGANHVLRQPAHPSSAAAAAAKKKNAEPEAVHQRKKSATLLTKAADMGKTPQGMEGGRPPRARVKGNLQAARLTDSESGEDSADEPDESWFAEHVDRQPNLRGPITDFGQWEESMVEYNGKHAVYCRLQQEIEGAKTQVKGWQQAIHKAVSDSQKVRLEQHLDLLWERLLPLLYKWDRAFAVLDEELEALYEHMQAFHDQRVAPMETE